MTIKSLSLITATLLLTTNTYADETLEPITIVSATKTTQSIQNTTSNVAVITAEEIEEKGYQTVAQAINTVAGISVTNSGGLGQQTSFFVRGADSGKVLVLLDGMRLNDPSTTDGRTQLEFLTTSNIEQIEIIKGGTGSIWGSNASAGVINIITKEAKNGIHGSIGLNYGSYATQGADLTLSFKDEKLTAQVLASYLDTNGFSALAPIDAESDGYTNKNLNLKLGYAFNANNTLSLSYNKVDSDIDYDVGSPDDSISKIDAKQDNIALQYAFTRDNYSALLLASKGKYDREATNPYSGLSTFDTIIKEYSVINALNYDLGKAILGFEYKDINGDNQYHSPGYNSISQADYTNKAVYLSNIYNIDANTLLETNLRFDDYSKFDNKTTYKIGLKHKHNFLKGFTTSANYYTSSDAPSAYQYANPVFGAILKPSYTKGFDISASYKDLFSVTYFKNTVEDYIDYDNTNYGYYNVKGTSKFSGLELESAYTLSDHNLIMSANYTHLFDYDDQNSEIRERRAEDVFNASVSYYTENDIHFGIDAQYIGDRIEYFYNTYNTKARTGNYTVWNLNFSTEVINNIDLTINAKNIFDKEYQSVYGYATEGQSLYAKIKYSF